MTSNDLLAWLVEASIVLGAATLMVLIIGHVARGRVAAVWIYALWLAVPAALAASLAPNGLLDSPLSVTVSPGGAGALRPDAVNSSRGLFTQALAIKAALAIWLAGAGLFLLHMGWTQRRFARAVVVAARRPTPAEARALAEDANGITLDALRDIRFTSALDSPLACGLRRAVVLLPEQFLTRYTAQERRVMVLHEAEHIRARHLEHRAAAAVLRSVFWFHPLAWLGERAFCADQEMACDHAVLRGHAAIRPRDYAAALLKAAGGIAGAQPRPPAASVPLIGVNHLKARTAMLTRHASLRSTRIAGLFMVAAVGSAAVLSGLSAAAPARAQTPDSSQGTGDFTVIDQAFPAYPQQAMDEGMEGECIIGFDIDSSGATENVRAVQCAPALFEASAVEAVRQWRYDPEPAAGARDRRVMIRFELPPEGEPPADEAENG